MSLPAPQNLLQRSYSSNIWLSARINLYQAPKNLTNTYKSLIYIQATIAYRPADTNGRPRCGRKSGGYPRVSHSYFCTSATPTRCLLRFFRLQQPRPQYKNNQFSDPRPLPPSRLSDSYLYQNTSLVRYLRNSRQVSLYPRRSTGANNDEAIPMSPALILWASFPARQQRGRTRSRGSAYPSIADRNALGNNQKSRLT